MSDETPLPVEPSQAAAETDVPPPPSAPSTTRPSSRRRRTAVPLALLCLLAFGVRWAALQPAPPSTPREAAALAAAQPAPAGETRPEADGTVALLTLARRFAPPPKVAPGSVEGLPTPPDPAVVAVRRLGAVLGAGAVVLLGTAAGALGGAASAILAGGLLALSPGAVQVSTDAGPGGLLLFAASGALLGLVAWGRRATVARAAGTGLFAGVAAAAGGGGAALLLGVPWALGADRKRFAALLACLVAAAAGLALGAPGSLSGLPSLPHGVASSPVATSSPLLAGLGLLAASTGWVAALLSLAGILRVLARRDAAGLAALVAAVGIFVATLARNGAESALLAGALPGVFLFAGLALADPREGESAFPASRLFVALALLAAAIGCARFVASRWAPRPAVAASDWIRRNLPDGAAFLLEEPDVLVPTAKGLAALKELSAEGVVPAKDVEAYAAGSKTFGPVPLPATGTQGAEAELFYDPNLAQFFPWMILRDPIPKDGASPELEKVRRLFHEYFRATWKEVATFAPGASRAPRLVVLQRPDKFELDRARLGPMGRVLGSAGMTRLRDRSQTLTAWVKQAGVELLAAGELPGARGFNLLATQRDSTDADAHFQLARVYLLRGRNDDAKQSLLTVLSLDPAHGGAHYNLGVILEDEGDVAGAETEYRAAIQFLPQPAIAHARLGALLAGRGDFAAARRELDTVRSLDPAGEADRYLTHVLGGS
ncbi:MAG: tetratricopeptide repeat protein [bacterium]